MSEIPVDIILDLDGPILDGRLRHHACFSLILGRHGRTPIPLDQYWEMKRARHDRRVQLRACGAADLYETFLAEWLATIETDEMLAHDQLQPGAVAALRELLRRGHRLTLATARRDAEALHTQLDRIGIASCFATVLTADPTGDVAHNKSTALRSFSDRFRSAAFVGDTEADVSAARQLGCHMVAVTCGIRNESILSALAPDELVPDLATWVAAHPPRVQAPRGLGDTR